MEEQHFTTEQIEELFEVAWSLSPLTTVTAARWTYIRHAKHQGYELETAPEVEEALEAALALAPEPLLALKPAALLLRDDLPGIGDLPPDRADALRFTLGKALLVAPPGPAVLDEVSGKLVTFVQTRPGVEGMRAEVELRSSDKRYFIQAMREGHLTSQPGANWPRLWSGLYPARLAYAAARASLPEKGPDLPPDPQAQLRPLGSRAERREWQDSLKDQKFRTEIEERDLRGRYKDHMASWAVPYQDATGQTGDEVAELLQRLLPFSRDTKHQKEAAFTRLQKWRKPRPTLSRGGRPRKK